MCGKTLFKSLKIVTIIVKYRQQNASASYLGTNVPQTLRLFGVPLSFTEYLEKKMVRPPYAISLGQRTETKPIESILNSPG
jgi:hypothetical protein